MCTTTSRTWNRFLQSNFHNWRHRKFKRHSLVFDVCLCIVVLAATAASTLSFITTFCQNIIWKIVSVEKQKLWLKSMNLVINLIRKCSTICVNTSNIPHKFVHLWNYRDQTEKIYIERKNIKVHKVKSDCLGRQFV